MASLPGKVQDVIVETATEVKGLLANDQAADAYALWQNSKFDNDQKAAFWSQLDSKQRGVLGRMAEAEEAQNQGVISPAKHKRLEAIIKELKLNRDGVKAYCKVEFGVEHLNQLSNDQYAALDTEIGKGNPILSAAPTTAPPPASPVSVTPAEPQTVGATINEAQESAILDLLELHGLTIAAFLKQASIHKILELKAERFDGATKWIKTHNPK